MPANWRLSFRSWSSDGLVPLRIAGCEIAAKRHCCLPGGYILDAEGVWEKELVQPFWKSLRFEFHISNEFGGSSDATNCSTAASGVPFAHIEVTGKTTAVGGPVQGLDMRQLIRFQQHQRLAKGCMLRLGDPEVVG